MASACLEQQQTMYASQNTGIASLDCQSCSKNLMHTKSGSGQAAEKHTHTHTHTDGHKKAVPLPETAQDITAGAIRAQVLVSVTGVNDADGTGHTGVEAGDGVVKDYEGDSKGGANGC